MSLNTRFDQRGGRIRADDRGIRAAADHHLDRIEDDGFARAGLAGEDDQPGSQLEIELVDDRKILDVQFSQHGR